MKCNALAKLYIVLFLLYVAIDFTLAALVPEDTVAACAVIYGLKHCVAVFFHLFHHNQDRKGLNIYVFNIFYIVLFKNIYQVLDPDTAELMAISAILQP